MSKKIILAKTAGFCFGVDRAVNLVYDSINKGEKVCTLGPIIHNAQLVSDLEKRGVKIINSPDEAPKDYKIIVRTHGVEKEVIDDINQREIMYTDATCPFVKKIHNIVRKLDSDTAVLIAGDENHPEVLGIRSYCNGDSFVFRNVDELEKIIQITI